MSQFPSKLNYSETCKPTLIRTKEKYRFRQVIGLDRLTFTALGNNVYQNLKYLHPQSINYINNHVVYCCLDMYSISYQITKLLVFLIMAWNQLVVVFVSPAKHSGT